MSKEYKKTEGYLKLPKEYQLVVDKAETTKMIKPLKAENVKGFKGIYFWFTKTGILIYIGKSFPKTLEAATRIKQHLSGDLTVSSAARYFQEAEIFPDIDESLLKYKDNDDELIHIKNAYRRDLMLSTMRVKLLEVPERFSDNIQTENFLFSYYKNIESNIGDSITSFSGVELVNKPGKDKYRDDTLRRFYNMASSMAVNELGYSVKGLQTKHYTLRLKVPFGSSKDYFNLTSVNFTSSKFKFYLCKSEYSDASIERFASFLISKGVDYKINRVCLRISFKFSPDRVKASFLEAETFIKEMLENR